MSNYKAEIEFAKKLAYEAGEIMLKYFDNHEVKIKPDQTPVTIADEEINQLVIDKVKHYFPDDGVLGEEASDHNNQSRMWVVDPIDGTKPYTYGLMISFFSLGFVVDGEVQFGVCYRPFDDTLYFGDGKIATKNNQNISVSEKQLGKDVMSCAMFFSKSPLLKNNEKLMRSVRESFTFAVDFYCIVAQAMLVAEGKIEAAFYPYNGAHDLAGLKPIIEGAGGKVTDIFGEDQRYDEPVRGGMISNGYVHDDLVKMIHDSES